MDEYIVKSEHICDDEMHEFVERIVRCRDCNYFVTSEGICSYRKPLYFTVRGDGFCAWAKPRVTSPGQ